MRRHAAKPIDGPDRGAQLHHVLWARRADGFAVMLAMGDLVSVAVQ